MTDDSLVLVEHDPLWASAFDAEAAKIRAALAPIGCFVDHVGSTAVRGLSAKPTIDVLVTLRDGEKLAAAVSRLVADGYREGEQVAGAEPARYLGRRSDDGALAANVHVVPPSSAHGRRMIDFRDALASDGGLADEYASLKQDLAARHPADLDAYTAGKSKFVRRVLAEASGAFGMDQLLTHQRAELDRSQKLQMLVIAVQFALAALAAVSVFHDDNATLLRFAVSGFVLAAVWLWLGRKHRKHRSAGDLARRVVLLGSGLGDTLSAEQQLRIFDAFSVSIEGRPLVREEGYFASRAAPGPRRLAEMIEESAFWTADLQRTSAAALRWSLAGGCGVLALHVWTTLPGMAADAQISMARVLVAILVFLVSSDVVGAALSHQEAARAIGEIQGRVEATAARDHPAGDILLLMADYNSAVETAPVALPFAMALRRRTLNRRWREYLQTKGGG